MGWDWDYAAEPAAAAADGGSVGIDAVEIKLQMVPIHGMNRQIDGGAPPAPAALPPSAPPSAPRLRRGQRAACPCTGDVLAVERGGREPLLRAQDGALHVCPAATLARAAAGRPRHGSGSVQVALSVSREELARWRERPDVRALGFSAAVRNVLERAWA